MPESDRLVKVALFGSIDSRKKQLIDDLKPQFATVGLKAEFEVVQKKFLSEEDGDSYSFWLASLVIDPLAAGAMLSSWRESSAFPFHKVPSAELSELFGGASRTPGELTTFLI
ncbi:MAG: hypothetical protein AB7G93_10410 [Bdellovibrionales bacterium]